MEYKVFFIAARFLISQIILLSLISAVFSLRTQYHTSTRPLLLSISPEVKASDRLVPFLTAFLIFFPLSSLATENSMVDSPVITSKVSLDVSIARSKPEKVTIGLFGNDSPASTKFFLSICKGDSVNGLSYDGSQVSTIVKDEKIEINKFALGANLKQETYKNEVGIVRIRSIDLAESAVYDDINDLNHDSPGIVSMKRGGGNFGFTIAPKSNPELDKENIIIGKVTNGLDVINQINDIPVSKEDSLGSKAGFANLAKSGGDGRGKIASLNRPLKKVKINQCVVEDSASLASFMKF